MWDCVDRGSMISPRPQTLPRHTRGAWFDLETSWLSIAFSDTDLMLGFCLPLITFNPNPYFISDGNTLNAHIDKVEFLHGLGVLHTGGDDSGKK